MNQKTPLEEIKDFFSQYKLLNIKKGETIIRPDDNDYAYYIREGYIRLHIYSDEGKEVTAVVLQPDEIFPLSVSFEDLPNIYWFESITPTKLYKAPAEEFRKFVTSDVKYFEVVSRQNVLYLKAIIYRLQHIILGKAGQTVASVILIYAKLLGKRKSGSQEVSLKIPITHQHISFSAGLTRETTSVEIKKLQDSGLIKYNGRNLVVCNLEALEKEAFV